MMLAVAIVASVAGCAGPGKVMVVSRPVVDVRRQPQTQAAAATHDLLEDTQLLFGERVRVLDTREGWARIEAMEQLEYTSAGKWQGYPGWIPVEALVPSKGVWDPTIVVTAKWSPVWRDPSKRHLSGLLLPMGAMVRATDMGGERWRLELPDRSSAWIDAGQARTLDELARLPVARKRALIVQAAEQLLRDPYFWGGRSPHVAPALGPVWPGPPQADAVPVTGVDCSGLVNLAYRTVGLAIPRDAHEQHLKARPITAPQPADLIFLSEARNPARIVHVMLYAGHGEVIEGPGTGHAVRRIALAQRLGDSLERLPPGRVVNDQTISYGAYLE